MYARPYQNSPARGRTVPAQALLPFDLTRPPWRLIYVRGSRFPGLELGVPIIRRQPGRVIVETPLTGVSGLWTETRGPDDVLDRIGGFVEPFVPVAVLAAALKERALRIAAPVDATFMAGITLSLVPLLSMLYDLPAVPITVKHVRRTAVRAWATSLAPRLVREHGRRRIGLLFSAGIDSFYSLMLLQRAHLSPTMLINVNAGAHDDDRDCWEKRLLGVMRIGERIGASTVAIDTNFHKIIRMSHARVHTLRNVSAAYLLSRSLDSLVYSSGASFMDIGFDIGKSVSIAYLDHAATASFAWSKLPVMHLGWDATRIAKTAAIADYPLSHQGLDVCTDQRYQARKDSTLPTNCGRCLKCVRTMVTLDHFRQLDAYASQFDLLKYRKNRNALFQMLTASTSPLDQEVVALHV